MGLVIYIDRLLLLNTLVNYLLLSATARLTGETSSRPRRWLSATLGGCYVLTVFLPEQQFWNMITLKLLCAGNMAAICFGFRRQLLRQWLLLLAISALYGGAVLLIETLLGGSVTLIRGVAYYPVSFSALLITALGLWLLFSTVLARLGGHSGGDLVAVELCLLGMSVHCTALLDTGNSLRDPISGNPALIVDWSVLHTLLSLAPEHLPADATVAMMQLKTCYPQLALRLLPCKTAIGRSLMIGLRCQSVRINGQLQPGALIAIAAEDVSDGGAYQALTGGI